MHVMTETSRKCLTDKLIIYDGLQRLQRQEKSIYITSASITTDSSGVTQALNDGNNFWW